MASTKESEPTELSAGLVMVCDWLPPSFGAVGQYMLEFAKEQAFSGSQALLIGLGHDAIETETRPVGQGSLTVWRLAAPPATKGSLLQRGLWALRTNFALVRAVNHGIRQQNKVMPGRGRLVVTGSPPFLSTIILLINHFVWKRHITYRMTDFYPETILAAGKAPWLKLLLPAFKRVRDLADTLEVLSQDQTRRLLEQGLPSHKIMLRRDRAPIDIRRDAEPLPTPFEPHERILLYSGNLGVAHPIDVFCEAYRQHIQKGSNRVRLWMNGQGARINELRAYCATHGLPLYTSSPVPLEQLPRLLITPDAHLILLGKPFWAMSCRRKFMAASTVASLFFT